MQQAQREKKNGEKKSKRRKKKAKGEKREIERKREMGSQIMRHMIGQGRERENRERKRKNLILLSKYLRLVAKISRATNSMVSK